MVEHMKWWGWGNAEVFFRHDDNPALRGFLLDLLDVDVARRSVHPPRFEDLTIPESLLPHPLHTAFQTVVGSTHVRTDAADRVVHTYGKSLRDLVRLRAGDLGRLPDVVVYPGTEEEAADVFDVAMRANAVMIPFGGGSNVNGSLEAPRGEARPVVSVDLGRMNRVLEIDPVARLARIQAGSQGPELERQLGEQGWTLGHFPDSFMHSTLGGWIATRSSGMQSDLYGDIADMVRSVRVITPAGILSTRPVPGSSSGPSVNEMVLGSEGRIGIITEAVVQIHRIPERREIRGYFLPTWESGLAAMAEIAGSEATALFTRLYDTTQTAFLLATSKGSRSATLLRLYLSRVRGYQLDQLSLSFIGFTGSAGQVRRQKRLVASIMSKHGGVGIGTGPGMLYEERKFDTPYIRDFLLDRDTLCDVSETAAPWSRLEELYAGVMAAAQKAFASTGVRGEVMCHLAHAYHSGASLNFTFAFRPEKRSQRLYQYDVIKGAIGQAFLDCGGTLSHHHGVGVEQARWLEDDVSAAATTLIRGLLRTADPGYNFNPGKIVN